MKKIVSLLSVLLVFALASHADPGKVILVRHDPIPGSRSVIPEVSADLTEDDLTIDVNRYLGNASVVIMDETSAPVLTNSTHVYGQATVTMDVSTLSSGHYILTITLSDGATYEGEFEITE